MCVGIPCCLSGFGGLTEVCAAAGLLLLTQKPPRTQEDAKKMLADFRAKRLGTQQIGDVAATTQRPAADSSSSSSTTAEEPKLV